MINEVRKILEQNRSDTYKKNVVKLGIPEEHALGVKTGCLRKLAKKIKVNHVLACELWESGIHEEKLLATLLFDKEKITKSDLNKLMETVISWDLCDHLCKNLITKTEYSYELIDEWCDHYGTYFKRGAFVLMTAEILEKKSSITEQRISFFLAKVKEHAWDNRVHVKKAISWTLREIGKINYINQEKAILLAYELMDSDNKWVGKDALKELETLVKVDKRGRLLSSKSKMGKNIYISN